MLEMTYRQYLHSYLAYRLGKSNWFKTQTEYELLRAGFIGETEIPIDTVAHPEITKSILAKGYNQPWFDSVPITY